MIHQLNPQIPLNTPKGPGRAVMVIDYSADEHLLWVVFLDESGECWTFANPEVRAQKNISLGRVAPNPFQARKPEAPKVSRLFPEMRGSTPVQVPAEAQAQAQERIVLTISEIQ